MSENLAQVIPIGACSVIYNGTDLGDTTANTKVTPKTKYVAQTAGKYGDTPVAYLLAGTVVEVDVELIQTDLANIQGSGIYPAFTKITGSGNTKLAMGQVAGAIVTKASLVLTPTISGNASIYVLTLTQASPIGDPELLYAGDKFQVWKQKFVGCIDTGQAAGSYIGTFGNPSATADAVAPTISAVVPADAASGVSTSTTIVWTVSKNLNSTTVTNNSVKLVATPGGAAGTEVACAAPVVVNAGASTTITLTPNSAIASGTTFLAILTSEITDQAGNKLATYVTKFST